jgi:hypothetical protein
VRQAHVLLLPLGEKVACEAGRMRGVGAAASDILLSAARPPSSVACGDTFSPGGEKATRRAAA